MDQFAKEPFARPFYSGAILGTVPIKIELSRQPQQATVGYEYYEYTR